MWQEAFVGHDKSCFASFPRAVYSCRSAVDHGTIKNSDAAMKARCVTPERTALAGMYKRTLCVSVKRSPWVASAVRSKNIIFGLFFPQEDEAVLAAELQVAELAAMFKGDGGDAGTPDENGSSPAPPGGGEAPGAK